MVNYYVSKFSSFEGNVVLSFLHFASGGVMLYFGFARNDTGRVELLMPKIIFNTTSNTVTSLYENAWNINLFFFNAIFLLFTGLCHFIYAMDHMFHRIAVRDLKKKLRDYVNQEMPKDMKSRQKSLTYHVTWSVKFRYFEYAFSAPLMLVIIATLSGVRDLFTLVIIFGCLSSTMFFGYILDTAWINGSRDIFMVSPFWLGCVPYLFAWVPIWINFYRALDGSIVKPPTFVYYIIAILFFFYSSFAVVQYYFVMWYKPTKKRGYTLLESDGVPDQKKLVMATIPAYDGWLNLLSLCAKLTLAFLVLGGFLNVI